MQTKNNKHGKLSKAVSPGLKMIIYRYAEEKHQIRDIQVKSMDMQ